MKPGQASGFVFALLGFAFLTMGDIVVKTMANEWPGTAIGAMRYSLGALGLAVILAVKEGKKGFAVPKPWIQIGRGISVSVAAVCFFTSLFLMPLATATSITFLNPMFAALLSAVVLKEKPPRGTITATLAAFFGVVIVLRPNLAEAGWAVILPLIAAAGMAATMLFNRMAVGVASTLSMQFLISIIAAPVLIAFALVGDWSGAAALSVSWPSWSTIARCAVVAITATVSHTFIYMATMRASAAQVAPMVYVQLLIAVALGWAIFGDQPDAQTLIGAGIIVASGLYLWQMQRRANVIE